MGHSAADQLKCNICVGVASFYSVFGQQKVYFCSSICHQEYNSRQADKPNLILVRVEHDNETPDDVQMNSPSRAKHVHSKDTTPTHPSSRVSSQGVEDNKLVGPDLLFSVVKRGTDEALAALLREDGVDVNRVNEGGASPLLVAAGMGATEKVAMLLAHGADVDRVDAEGKTALHKCSRWKKDTGCAKLIFARSSELVSKQDNFLQTPLHGAAGEGNDALVEFLVSEGASLTTVDNLGRTPLHWAIIQGQTSTAQLLLRHNADDVIDSGDRFGQRPLHYAVQTNRTDIAQLLIANNCKLEDSEDTSLSVLIYTIRNGDRDMCALIMKHCKNVDSVDKKGWTPLHHAVERGDTVIADSLLYKNPDMNVAEQVQRMTPILLAVSRGQLDMVSLLLARGCRILCYDNKRRSPIHCACARKSSDMLHVLLVHAGKTHQDGGKKCINAKDDSGQTALSNSAAMCDRECCRLLLEHGAKVDDNSKTRLIEMGLIAREVKRTKREDHIEADEKKPTEDPAPPNGDSEVQWKEILEKKKRLQKVYRKVAWSVPGNSTSPYADSLAVGPMYRAAEKDRGYLQMYATNSSPDKLPPRSPVSPRNSWMQQDSSAGYGKSYSYSMSNTGKP